MKPLIEGVHIAILEFRLVHVNVYMFCHVMSCHVSFTVSEKSLNTNENSLAKCREISLELSQSAMKFRLNYREVPRNFARTIGECSEISLSLKQ